MRITFHDDILGGGGTKSMTIISNKHWWDSKHSIKLFFIKKHMKRSYGINISHWTGLSIRFWRFGLMAK